MQLAAILGGKGKELRRKYHQGQFRFPPPAWPGSGSMGLSQPRSTQTHRNTPRE